MSHSNSKESPAFRRGESQIINVAYLFVQGTTRFRVGNHLNNKVLDRKDVQLAYYVTTLLGAPVGNVKEERMTQNSEKEKNCKVAVGVVRTAYD
jgi:hypothetical protein